MKKNINSYFRMRNILKFTWCSILLVCLTATSCNKFSIDITHRKYRPGYHIDFSSEKNTSKNSSFADKTSAQRNEVGLEKSESKFSIPYSTFNEAEPEVLHRNGSMKKSPQTITITSIPKEKAESVFDETKSQTIFFQKKEKEKTKNTSAFYLLGGVIGLLSAGLLLRNRKRAVKISHWSAKNPAKSKGIQFVGHVLLSLAGFVAGSMLYRHDVVATPAASAFFTSVFLGSIAFYPLRKKEIVLLPSAYRNIKLKDITLILGGVMMCSILGNQVASERLTASSQHVIGFKPSQKFFSTISAGTQKIDDALINLVQPEQGEKLSGGQIALLILITVGFGVLTLALALLSCVITCEGNGGLAALILVFGLALLIFLSVVATKAVMKMPGKKNPEIPEQK